MGDVVETDQIEDWDEEINDRPFVPRKLRLSRELIEQPLLENREEKEDRAEGSNVIVHGVLAKAILNKLSLFSGRKMDVLILLEQGEILEVDELEDEDKEDGTDEFFDE